MGKGLLLLVAGSLFTMMVVSNTFMRTTTVGVKNSMGYFEENYTRNMANTMVNMLLTRLADSLLYRQNSWETLEFFGGEAEYKVIDTVLYIHTGKWTGPPGQADREPGKFPHYWDFTVVDIDTVIKIHVNVTWNLHENSVITYTMQNRAGGWVPPVVRGAWTANADLNNTISDMYIDGRNHDLNLNIIPNTGTRAISTSVDFRNDENAAIGGTATDSTDYVLSFPEKDEVIEDEYNWGGNFPETPDEILGYPEGTLMKLAKSGAMGSQYVKDPKDIADALTFPLSGVTYVEITDGKERELKLDGTGGKQNSGVLVVHGPDRSSKLTGVKMETDKVKVKEPEDGGVIICHSPGTTEQETIIAYPAGEEPSGGSTNPPVSEIGDITITPNTDVVRGANVIFQFDHDKLKKCENLNNWPVQVTIDGSVNTKYLNDCELSLTIPSSADMLKLKIEVPGGKVVQDIKDASEGEVEWEFSEEGATYTLEEHMAHGDQLDDCPTVHDARFTGLIITDYSFHHHLDILGAVLQLSPDLEQDKNCNGNKDHWVYYSEQAVRDATEITALLSREIGNSDVRVYDVAGYGPGRQKASYYWE